MKLKQFDYLEFSLFNIHVLLMVMIWQSDLIRDKDSLNITFL